MYKKWVTAVLVISLLSGCSSNGSDYQAAAVGKDGNTGDVVEITFWRPRKGGPADTLYVKRIEEFKDDKYFYRVFKSRFGQTPEEYRRNYFIAKKI